MMGYYTKTINWRDEDVAVGQAEDLVATMAVVFERQAARALSLGALQGYNAIDSTSAVMRGKLRLPEQVRRHYGCTMPLEVTYDEFTFDIPENQLLLAATVRLLRLRRLPEEVCRQLRRIVEQLVGVRLLKPQEPIPQCPPTRLNERYQYALHLARLILHGSSAELGETDVSVSGFLLTMHRIFEDFICATLTEELTKYRGYTDIQRDIYLDEGNQVTITLTWFGTPARSGRWRWWTPNTTSTWTTTTSSRCSHTARFSTRTAAISSMQGSQDTRPGTESEAPASKSSNTG
ncbi:McrBC 5-methylcytosine restriction system component [Actinophytocola oryzae]|uniref:McrBC 5-methylcytosine restriction system component n=2 Tax=Actinophytocola oryzae TaxID=502181 RepID=A0A4R7VR12_9PSEU|nr:McrBC 5-methylcytosine restriction system component [Actinophytocola oryzae]